MERISDLRHADISFWDPAECARRAGHLQVTIELADGWLEGHRARLDRVRQVWPMRRN
ncbi:DUF5959 family protein [Streptomyces sp. NPDC055721]|uniref:DUF5959 family protein n=1 Tax=Streptomyces sp. NPDC127132 TaxID=3345374 RepID=UPI003637447E